MGSTLLIAHGDTTKARFFEHYLAHYGFEVETVASGVDCLAKLRIRKPAVLVLDQALPWGGGDGVIDSMREDNELRLIPVIVLGKGMTERPVTASSAPVVRRLPEFYQLCELVDSIRTAARLETRSLEPDHTVDEWAGVTLSSSKRTQPC